MHKKRRLPFKMGCDPEFNLTLIDHKIPQDIVDMLYGEVFPIKNSSGELGSDANALAEMRPKPADEILELANNIKTILKQAGETLGAFGLTTKSINGSAVGGHIHIGIGKKMPENELRDRLRFQISSFYLPIMLGEDQENNKLRLQGGYGTFGDLRFEHKGGNSPSAEYTCEIRTPTAEWITTPKTMIAVFSYMAVVVNEILNHQANIQNFEDFLIKDYGTLALLEQKARKRDMDYLNPIIKKIKKAVKTFELYSMFKKEIEWLFKFDEVQEEKKKANYDALVGWNLRSLPTIKDLADKENLLKEIKKIDKNYNQYYSYLPIFTTNPDQGMAEIVHDVQKTLLTKKWNITQKFILFGLAKPIKTAIVAKLNNTEESILLGGSKLSIEDLGDVKRALQKMRKRYDKDNDTFYIGVPKHIRETNDFHKVLQLIQIIESSTTNKKYLEKLNSSKIDIKNIVATKKVKKQVKQKVPAPAQYHKLLDSEEDEIDNLDDRYDDDSEDYYS